MIKQAFEKNCPLFIPFIVAGHPTPELTIQTIMTLASAGADIIELGVPFSDPVADGAVNQRAAEIALSQNVTLDVVLEIIKKVRTAGCDTPIIIFSYLNPILSFGYEDFTFKARECGANGVLIVDLPPEEGQSFYTQLKNNGLEIILLTSPTTDSKRFDLYKKLDPAFIYYISRLSVTGTQTDLAPQLESEVRNLRLHFPTENIAVGFGISTPEQAAIVAKFADGVIVGSLLVKTLESEGIDALRTLATQLTKATTHAM